MPLRIAPTYRAAWVPARGDGPPDAALETAVAWWEERCAETGTRGLLVTNDKMTVTVTPRLLALARRHRSATPRTSAAAPWGVPVLAHRPDQAALHLAVQRAHGAALCVVEGVAGQVAGWASVTPAVALTPAGPGTGAATAAVDEQWLRTVTRLASGEHGMPSSPERTLAVLVDLPAHRRAQLPTALIARGAPLAEVRRVVKLLAEVRGAGAR
ncbi:hypothetical protein FHR75_001161 [Kineococcus radiotolerans]|uniref:Uncharacterized protein n=1 Tax=Kineococcus radiotolerans TaxID=131568 RepID=A0A7W4TKN0_KINRA|nr:hypothetical protein [Kineococcus radiotolerans]MBB2900373.1 hypothetical protein [Kineococcus radiotolerans]